MKFLCVLCPLALVPLRVHWGWSRLPAFCGGGEFSAVVGTSVWGAVVSRGSSQQKSSSAGSTSLPALCDVPSGTEEQDHLEFRFYAEALAFLIDWKISKPPLTVAISAPSGAGKSSLAQQVQEQLKTHGDWYDDHIICQFSAWKHDDAPNLGAAFAAKVAQFANEERYWWRRLIQPLPSAMLTPEQRWHRQLYVILASLAVALGLVLGPDTRDIITAAAQPTDTHWINAEHAAHGFGLTLIIILAALTFVYPKIFSGTQAVARFINDPKSEAARGSIDSVSKQLGGLIASATRRKRRFFVFVEDLDRCRPPRAVDVCEVVAQLLDQDDVVTVLVGDMNTISRAAAIKYRSLELPTPVNADPAAYDEYGRSYMEKLVQLRFDLPQPSKEQLEKLRNQLSSENDQPSPENDQLSPESSERPKQQQGYVTAFYRPLKIGGYTLIAAAGVAAYYSLTHLSTHARLFSINLWVILVIIGAGLALLTGIPPIARIRRREHERRTRDRIDKLVADQFTGKTISETVDALFKSNSSWNQGKESTRRRYFHQVFGSPEVTKQSVRRRYFKKVFDNKDVADARDTMYQMLEQFLPKEPRAIKKFAYQMRLAVAIGIARGKFKIEKGEAEKGAALKCFVDRFGKWLVLLDNWPIISQIGLDIELDTKRGMPVLKKDAEHGMHFFEKAALSNTSESLQELLNDCGLSDTDDVDRLREFLDTGPPFGDVSELASVIAAPRADEVTRRAIKEFRTARRVLAVQRPVVRS